MKTSAVSSTPEEARPAPRRRRRRWKILLLSLLPAVAVLAVLTALAPTLVSRGLGRGLIAGRIQKRINGTVDLGALSLSWTRAQSVAGFRVTDAGGQEVLRLDATVDSGLLGLLLGPERLDVTVAGALRAGLRPDGSTTLDAIVVPPEPPGAARGPGAPLSLEGVPALSVRVEGFALALRDQGSLQELTLESLRGHVGYEPGKDLSVELSTPTVGGGRKGSIALNGRVSGLFDGAGRLTARGAVAQLELGLAQIPVLLARRPATIGSLRLTARSDDLGERLTAAVTADAVVDGSGTGTLEADVTAMRPFSDDGSFRPGLDRLSGSVKARAMPTALLQPLLAGKPIKVARDLGPTLDIEATFTSGATGAFEVTASSEALRFELSGEVDPERRSVEGDRLHLSARVAPELLAEASEIRAEQPLRLALDVDRFSIIGERPAEAAVRGRLRLLEPATVRLAGFGGPLAVDSLGLEVDSPGLSRGVAVKAAGALAGAPVQLDLEVTGLFDEQGSLSPRAIRPAGTLSARKLGAGTLAALLPQRADLIEESLLAPLDVTVQITRGKDAMEAALSAVSSVLEARSQARWQPGGPSLTVERSRAEVSVTPGLVAAAQKGAKEPLLLARPARVVVGLDPMEVPWAALRGGAALPRALARISSEEIAVASGPRLHEPLSARGLLAEVELVAEPRRALSVSAQAQLHGADEPLGDVRLALGTARGAERPLERAELNVTGVDVGGWERVLGRRPGSLREFLGDAGSASAKVDGLGEAWRAEVGTNFVRLGGRYTATIDAKEIAVTADRSRLSLDRAAIQRRLLPEGASPDQPGVVRVTEDLPVTLEVRTLRLPRALLGGGPFDPSSVRVDVELSGGPLALSGGGYGSTSVENLRLSLSSDDLVRGVDFSLRSSVAAAEGREAGRLRLDGRVSGLVSDGELSRRDARVDLSLEARQMPTALVDLLGDRRGLLVAALGPWVEGDVTAKELSRTGGSLEGRLRAPNGYLSVWAAGREGALVIPESRPLKAELQITPALRQRLLYRIHPILADVRSTDQPLRATVSNATVPFEGKVSGLKADLEITVGRVELDSGSISLALLTAFNASNAATIPGEIEPIRARIRKGVVTYDRFAVKIDKYTLAYSGKVDLNRERLDLRTEVPLSGLAMSVKELRGYADQIVVPLVQRGKFGKAKLKVDPDFDIAAAAAEAGFRGGLRELLDKASRETGAPLGDLFEGVFGRKDQDDDEG